MKRQKIQSTPKPLPYPNAATPRERLAKIIDLLLTFAISGGLAVSILFLLTL